MGLIDVRGVNMIATFLSFPEYRSLLNEINGLYRVGATGVYLYRDMIGSVYFVESDARKYVFKLFRRTDTAQALQSLDVVHYLRNSGYPVVSVVPTCSGDSHMKLDSPEGQRVGILYHFLEGAEPELESDITEIGRQVGILHNLMQDYPNTLIRRGKGFFIDRWIDLMKEANYCSNRTRDLTEYGHQLWSSMEGLPAGFCHGDLHSGNIIRSASGTFTLFDFDIVSHAFPVIDVATLSDETDYNNLDARAFDDTRRTFERLYQGYSKERTLSDSEIEAIFDFVAIRHYELNATVTNYRLPLQGRYSLLGQATFDEQYEWLMKWRVICSRKKST